jgi:hypothetical protein
MRKLMVSFPAACPLGDTKTEGQTIPSDLAAITLLEFIRFFNCASPDAAISAQSYSQPPDVPYRYTAIGGAPRFALLRTVRQSLLGQRVTREF